MSMQMKMFTLLAMAALIVEVTMAANYTVGAPGGGWDLHTDLKAWASTQTFNVGDNILFSYSASHNVFEVSEADYGQCVTSNPITSDASGSTTFSLASPIKRYFICGTPGHCLRGMKVEIDTLATSTPPPPATTPARPPPYSSIASAPSSLIAYSPYSSIASGPSSLIAYSQYSSIASAPYSSMASPPVSTPPLKTPSPAATPARPPPPSPATSPPVATPSLKTPSPPPVTKSPPTLPPTSDSSSSSSSNISTTLVVGIAVAGVIGLAVLSLLFFFCRKKRRRDRSDNHVPPPPNGYSQITFTYKELATATNGFSDSHFLGQGGFGYVHKGVLPNGQEVAVKQLRVGSGQGEREFQAEVQIISRVHHKHLVSLVGYCMTKTSRFLVYECVPNNTMEFHLHGEGRPAMDWPTRLRIAVGSAKGLAYLHEDCHPKIIHRDIKAANILLDFNFEAKVADFGLAKLSSDLNTHVSTRVMGTFGYLAPEYAASGKLTEKSDVFSFGVMLLELITGRRPVDTKHTYMNDSLVDWARPLLTRALEEGNFSTLVDERLHNDYDHDEMLSMVSCAEASVRHSARRRPRMSQIVRALEGHASLSDLNEGIKPGQSTIYSSHESLDYDTSQYKEDIKKFRKMALGTQEMGSGKYSSGNPSGSSSEGRNTQEMEMGKTKRNNSHGFS